MAKELLINLINHPSHYQFGIQKTRDFQNRLLKKFFDDIGNTLLTKANSFSSSPPQMRIFLDPLIDFSERCSLDFKDKFADQLLEYLTNSNVNLKLIGEEYYDKFREHIKSEKIDYIGQQLVISLTGLRDQINDNTKPMLNVLIKEQGRLEKDTIVNLIDILTGLLPEAKPANVRKIGFEYLKRLNKLYHRASSVLDQLFTLARTAPDGTKELPISTLISFKQFKGKENFRKEVKRFLNEIKKSNNENDKKVAEQASKELE